MFQEVLIDVVLSDDAINDFFRNAGKIKLLNAEQEVTLGTLIQQGLNANKVLEEQASQLNPDEIERLSKLVARGLDARDAMVAANLRLVVSIARKFQGRGLDYIDLIQEGNIGLLKAVQKFDPTKGYKFSTYGTWWIRQAIQRALGDTSTEIRVPVHVHDKINVLNRVEKEHFQLHGVEIDIEEASKQTGFSVDKIDKIRKARAVRATISYHTVIGDDDFTLLDKLGDVTYDPKLEDDNLRETIVEKVREALSTLSERDRDIVLSRFADDEKTSLEELGTKYGYSREYIRNIQNAAMAKLREMPEMHEVVQLLRDLE